MRTRTLYIIIALLTMTIATRADNETGGSGERFDDEDIVTGDLDGDGSVSIRDMAMLVALLNGTRNEELNLALNNADVNDDGTMDIKDVTALKTILLNAQYDKEKK